MDGASIWLLMTGAVAVQVQASEPLSCSYFRRDEGFASGTIGNDRSTSTLLHGVPGVSRQRSISAASPGSRAIHGSPSSAQSSPPFAWKAPSTEGDRRPACGVPACSPVGTALTPGVPPDVSSAASSVWCAVVWPVSPSRLGAWRLRRWLVTMAAQPRLVGRPTAERGWGQRRSSGPATSRAPTARNSGPVGARAEPGDRPATDVVRRSAPPLALPGARQPRL